MTLGPGGRVPECHEGGGSPDHACGVLPGRYFDEPLIRRTSNKSGVVQRVTRLMRHLQEQGRRRTALSVSRPGYQPHKLSQRLSDETVTAILDAYRAGATTREVGERFHLAHSSINKLLRQHGVKTRRHRSRCAQSGPDSHDVVGSSGLRRYTALHC